MLHKFHKNEKGFTLIELLVVIAIIGILAAVAIPQFATYRQNAYCSRVESDVNNTMLALEAYYAANDAYAFTPAALGVAESTNVTLTITGGTTGVPIKVVGHDDTPANGCPKGSDYELEQGTAPVWTGTGS